LKVGEYKKKSWKNKKCRKLLPVMDIHWKWKMGKAGKML
jgi:hypothetical protein